MLKFLVDPAIRMPCVRLGLGLVLVFWSSTNATGQYTMKADAESAIVWSGDQCQKTDNLLITHDPLCDGISGIHADASSLVLDPLTGSSLRKISYEGVDVISGLRSDALGCGWSDCHTSYTAFFTIENNTEYPVVLDARTFSSTLPIPTPQEVRKWWGKKAKLADIEPSSQTLQPGRSVRVYAVMIGTGADSNITKWWHHSFFFVVPLRYAIRINGKDFVFPWLAPVQQSFVAVPKWDY